LRPDAHTSGFSISQFLNKEHAVWPVRPSKIRPYGRWRQHLGVLAAAGLLGDVPGEWSRAALLAYAAVLLGLLTGIGSASGTLPVLGASLLALGGLFDGFAALSLGGARGHTLLAAAFAALTALAWLRSNIGLPWPLALVGALACVIAIVRVQL
jgi:hypothetical protein